jgi:hypothetical protein
LIASLLQNAGFAHQYVITAPLLGASTRRQSYQSHQIQHFLIKSNVSPKIRPDRLLLWWLFIGSLAELQPFRFRHPLLEGPGL